MLDGSTALTVEVITCIPEFFSQMTLLIVNYIGRGSEPAANCYAVLWERRWYVYRLGQYQETGIVHRQVIAGNVGYYSGLISYLKSFYSWPWIIWAGSRYLLIAAESVFILVCIMSFTMY